MPCSVCLTRSSGFLYSTIRNSLIQQASMYYTCDDELRIVCSATTTTKTTIIIFIYTRFAVSGLQEVE